MQDMKEKALRSAAWLVVTLKDKRNATSPKWVREMFRELQRDALNILAAELDAAGLLSDYKLADGTLSLPDPIIPERVVNSDHDRVRNLIVRAVRLGADTEDLITEAHERGVDISDLNLEKQRV